MLQNVDLVKNFWLCLDYTSFDFLEIEDCLSNALVKISQPGQAKFEVFWKVLTNKNNNVNNIHNQAEVLFDALSDSGLIKTMSFSVWAELKMKSIIKLSHSEPAIAIFLFQTIKNGIIAIMNISFMAYLELLEKMVRKSECLSNVKKNLLIKNIFGH